MRAPWRLSSWCAKLACMTTLELAQAIARAVLKAVDCDEAALAPHEQYFTADGPDDPDGHGLSRVVLEVLRETGHWFCRVTEDPKLGTVDVRFNMLEMLTDTEEVKAIQAALNDVSAGRVRSLADIRAELKGRG